MKLTIEQTLQKGIDAHTTGDFQQAERSYQAILKIQPTHPNANHNLGIISVSVNELASALHHFKIALDVNPAIGQFWISYIDTLIMNDELVIAKKFIKKAKKRGVNTKNQETLLKKTRITVGKRDLPQRQITNLVEHYENGRFSYAEKLAASITQTYPKNQLPWKVLGAVLARTGRQIEALSAYQTAIMLSPQDFEAYSDLGVVLQELGRLDDSEASCRQAIELNPDHADAHYNLGITLSRAGRLNEAKESFTKAISSKPEHAQAYCNLGNTLDELGCEEEANASYIQALVLNPEYSDAARNLVKTPLEKLDIEILELCENAFHNSDDSLENKIKHLFFQGNILKHKGLIEISFNKFREANRLRLQINKINLATETNRNKKCLVRIDKWIPRQKKISREGIAKLFIIGPSRSGKSLIEYILNKNSHVKALYETISLDNILDINKQENSNELAFKNIFLHSEDDLAQKNISLITSSNPRNAFYLDYLFDTLTNVYFVQVTRDISDLAPEIFTNEYENNNFYSCDPKDIAKYIDIYNKIFDICSTKIPERCLKINFEEIVKSPENVITKISNLTDFDLSIELPEISKLTNLESQSIFRNCYSSFKS